MAFAQHLSSATAQKIGKELNVKLVSFNRGMSPIIGKWKK